MSFRHYFEIPCQISEQTVQRLPRKTGTDRQTDIEKYSIGWLMTLVSFMCESPLSVGENNFIFQNRFFSSEILNWDILFIFFDQYDVTTGGILPVNTKIPKQLFTTEHGQVRYYLVWNNWFRVQRHAMYRWKHIL